MLKKGCIENGKTIDGKIINPGIHPRMGTVAFKNGIYKPITVGGEWNSCNWFLKELRGNVVQNLVSKRFRKITTKNSPIINTFLI